jgi:hypothetical protein
MTLAEVIALINSDIVPNGNNEITANVLRPILIEMLQQPNDLIGELDELNTIENDTLVKAINSINNALSDVDGLTILSGQGDPNGQSFPSLSIADLYSEIDGLGSPLALWIYDGTKFIRFSDKYLSYEIPQTLTPIEQQTARNNIGALDVKMAELSSDLTESEKAIIRQKLSATSLEDLNGLLENPTYDSDTHIFTMDIVGGGTFSIDFPIEALITNVDLDDDNNLVITFEDGSEVLVPLNTLLVGVVKMVNGKNPNSQGVVTVNIVDIPNLQDELDNKANVNGDNLTNIGTWQSNLNVITTNTNQTGLSGSKTTSGIWSFNSNNAVPLRVENDNTSNISIRYGLGDTYWYAGLANSNVYAIGNTNSLLSSISNRLFWIDNNGRVFSRNGFSKVGSTDDDVLLGGGGHIPVSDFALAGSLDNYVTVNSSQNITAPKTFTVAPIVPSGMLNGHTVNLGQLNTILDDYLTEVSWGDVSGKPTSFPPSAHTHPISDITNLQGELDNKANTDGTNTIGGDWTIDSLTNNDVGSYVTTDVFTNATIGIPSTDALGSTIGMLLMKDGKPIVIAENSDTNWDGYIYRYGTPLSGYPSNQQNGNYLIESKHRFRLYEITAPDSTSGGDGLLTVQPFNGIEHSFYRVTISSVNLLEIDIKPPTFDEITGFAIARNAIGQKCTVAVSGSMTGVKFTSVSGADFTNNWNKGVFTFYWTGTDWMFGGYSPIEP